MGYESVDLLVTDSTPLAAPIAGVFVKVLSQDGRILFTTATTDVNGQAGFLLPSGQTYQLRYFKQAVSLPNPQYFEVLPTPLAPGQTNTLLVTGQLVAPPLSTDPRLCVAFGYFRGPDGSPASNTEIHFMPEFNPLWLDGAGILKERVIVSTDDKGYAQIPLIRFGKYSVTVAGAEDIVRHISVPDAVNVNLVDLLFPIVQLVELYAPGPYTLSVAAGDYVVQPQVYASDGELLQGSAISDVAYASSDPTVLLLLPTNNTLVLRPVAPGTASIIVRRLDLSIVHIPDPGVSVPGGTVTVVP
jgi:hypothetical protein